MLTNAKKSIALVQGVMENSFFDLFKRRNGQDIFVLEGRPSLEAAKQVTAQFTKRQVVPTMIADNMAGVLFYKNLVKEIWVAYQFTEQKGALCDIGALILGVLGKRHKVPLYLYPSSIKRRLMGDQKDIVTFGGVPTAPRGIKGYAPLVEWLPKKYITKIYE